MTVPVREEGEVNNDALVAALGMEAVAAVDGYRQAVIAEATRRGHRLLTAPLSGVVSHFPGDCVIIDPIDIRLTFEPAAGSGDLAGRTLTWSPACGWVRSPGTGGGQSSFYAGPDPSPLDLVPVPSHVLDWAVGELDGNDVPPGRLDLDEDPEAIRRLLGFLDRHSGFSTIKAFSPHKHRREKRACSPPSPGRPTARTRRTTP